MKSLVYLKNVFHKNKKKIAIQFENKKITYEQLYFEILNLSDCFKKKKLKKSVFLKEKMTIIIIMYACLLLYWLDLHIFL